MTEIDIDVSVPACRQASSDSTFEKVYSHYLSKLEHERKPNKPQGGPPSARLICCDLPLLIPSPRPLLFLPKSSVAAIYDSIDTNFRYRFDPKCQQ